MKKVLVISLMVLLAGCGGSKLQLNNATGNDLASVTLTIGEESQTWHNISANKTFGSDLPIPDGAVSLLITWESAGEEMSMEYLTIDSASRADKISILFSPDEISVNYAF